MRDYKKVWLLVSLFLFSLLLLAPSVDKYWAPYDEGNYLNTSSMVLEGMTPYRDFLLIMYPPGQAYTLAGLLSIFGMNLLVGRLYNIVLFSVICTTVFYIAKKVASPRYAFLSFLVILTVLASFGEPPIPRPIWPGVALSMLAVLFFVKFIEDRSLPNFLLSSLFNGFAVLFRHDTGFLTLIAVLSGVVAYSVFVGGDKKGIKSLFKRILKLSFTYLIIPIVFVIIFVAWLYKNNAVPDAYKALVILPASFRKWAAIPFPEFCFDLNMIFHRGCAFIKSNKFYIPIIVCAVSAMFFVAELVSKRKLEKKDVFMASLVPLGVLYLQQLIFRVDPNHLAVAFPPSAILFGALFAYSSRPQGKMFKMARFILVSAVSLLMLLMLYKNIESYIKAVYVKPFIKRSIEPVSFKRGRVYIPDDVRDEFLQLVKYVRENTEGTRSIYVGQLNHSVPQMGWFDLIYFLTDRLPPVKSYVMIPGFQSKDDVQKEMILNLKNNKVKVLLLRDYGDTDTLGPLDKYIREAYRLDKIIGSHHIHVKK